MENQEMKRRMAGYRIAPLDPGDMASVQKCVAHSAFPDLIGGALIYHLAIADGPAVATRTS